MYIVTIPADKLIHCYEFGHTIPYYTMFV